MDSASCLLRQPYGNRSSERNKTVGETLSAIAQGFKHEGEEKRKQMRIDEGKQIQNPASSAKELPKEMKKNPSNQK